MGVLEIMDTERGDEQLEWDPADEQSVKKARTTFEKKLAEGWRAFTTKVVERVVKDKEIKEFDPSLSRILLTPQMIPSPSFGRRSTELPPLHG